MAVTSLAPSNGWWAVRDSNGAIGVVKGTSPGGNAVRSVYLGAANNLNDLFTNGGAAFGSAQTKLGATDAQWAALVDQLDVAAGKNPATSYIYVAPNVKPGSNAGVSSNTSTTNTGDATPANLIPSLQLPNVIGNIWQWLTTPAHWLRILEYVAGAVLIFIAVDKLIGGPSVSTVVKEAAR